MGQPTPAFSLIGEPDADRTEGYEERADATRLRQAMGTFPTGVALLGCGSGETTQLLTINSVLSVSLDPMLLLVSVRAAARIRAAITVAAGYSVNILTQEQRDLSVRFAASDRPAGIEASDLVGGRPGRTGHVLADGVLAALECRVIRADPAGDHVLFVGHVETIHLGHRPAAAPLVFHRGGYRGLQAE